MSKKKGLLSSKKAQFYFFAALIIIGMVSGILIISNYAKKTNYQKIYEIGAELEIESEKVLDYGTNQGKSRGDKITLLTEFATKYIDYIGGEKNLYFFFADTSGTVIIYQNSQETIRINDGQEISGIQIEQIKTVEFSITSPNDKEINVNITKGGNENNYKFKLKNEADNFYFIISEEVNGEKHVANG